MAQWCLLAAWITAKAHAHGAWEKHHRGEDASTYGLHAAQNLPGR
jgi:hypothetical protein